MRLTRMPRLLPVTCAAMTLLFGVKTATLLRLAFPGVVSPAMAAPPPPAAPLAVPSLPVPTLAVAPPGGTAGPPISDSERALLLDLRQRRTALDARAALLDAREALMAAATHRLDARLDQLTALQTSLQGLEQARRDHDEANWAGLVKLYEAMKPRDAATIFDDLDMAVMLPVVDRMKDAKAAAILAAMDPAKARILTARLAEQRLRANSVGANSVGAGADGAPHPNG